MSKQLAKNTLYLTLAYIGQKIIAFVYFLFLARIMMPEQTGEYFLVTSIVAIFFVVGDFGINAVVIREIAKKPEQAKTFVQRSLGTKLPFVLLGIVGAVIAAWVLQYDIQVQQLIWLATGILALDSFSSFFYGVLRGHQLLKYEAVGMFSGQLISSGIGALVLWQHPSLYLLVIALMSGSLLNACISMWFVVKRHGAEVIRPIWSSVFARRVLAIALPFALAGAFVKVNSYFDSILISKFLDTVQVGIYSIAYKFTYAFQFLPLAFVAVLYPAMSSVVNKDSKKLANMFNQGMWYMMIIATPIVFGLWLIAPQVVLLAGPEYIAAAPVLQTLAFVLLPIFLDFPIGSLLNASGRQSTKTAITGMTMVINVVTNILFIPAYGIIGATYAALISFTFMFVAGMYFVPQLIPGYDFRPFAKIIAKIMVSGIVMVLSGIWISSFVHWVMLIPIGAAVYALMLFLTRSVTREQLTQARSLLRP